MKLLRFLWIILQKVLGFAAAMSVLLACVVCIPLMWDQSIPDAPWWAYVLSFIGTLIGGAFGLLCVVAIPWMIWETLSDIWKEL